MATNKEIREALRKAKKAGVRVSRLPNSHWLLEAEGDKAQVPFSPGTSGSVQRNVRKIRKFAEEHCNER